MPKTVNRRDEPLYTQPMYAIKESDPAWFQKRVAKANRSLQLPPSKPDVHTRDLTPRTKQKLQDQYEEDLAAWNKKQELRKRARRAAGENVVDLELVEADTRLHDAVFKADVDAVRALLKEDPKMVTWGDRAGEAPLMIARRNREFALRALEADDRSIVDVSAARREHVARLGQVEQLLLAHSAPLYPTVSVTERRDEADFERVKQRVGFVIAAIAMIIALVVITLFYLRSERVPPKLEM